MELALAVERFQVPDDRQKDFLADLLRVFPREVVSKPKNEASCRGVMPIEQLVPGRRLTAAAAREQLSLRLGTHAVLDNI